MLQGIPKMISPELLKLLCEMGHGDQLVISLQPHVPRDW